MLIIDDESGNYKPAHKSMLEFFVAYKFATDLGLLKDEYMLTSKDEPIDPRNERKTYDILSSTLNKLPFNSKELYLVYRFFKDLIKEDIPYLWDLFDRACINKDTNKIFINNILTILSDQETDFVNRNFDQLEFHDIIFKDSDFRNCNFKNSVFFNGGMISCELANANFENVKMLQDGGHPSLRDISGYNLFDFTNSNDIVRVARLGFEMILNTAPITPRFIPFDDKKYYLTELEILRKHNLLLAANGKMLVLLNLQDCAQKVIKAHTSTINGIVGDPVNERFATFTDGFRDGGDLKIWNINQLTSHTISFKNNGIFTCCFMHQDNILIAGGRDGSLYWIDLNNDKIIKTITFDGLRLIGKKKKLKLNHVSSEYIYSLCITTDDRLLAIGSTYQCILIWDLINETIAFKVDLDGGYCVQLAFSPDNKYLAYHAIDKGFAILKTSDWSEVYTDDTYCETIKFSDDSKYIIFGDFFESSEIFQLQLSTLEVINTFSCNLDFTGMNIKKMQAPINIIRYFLKRGANGWYTKQHLLDLPEQEYVQLYHILTTKNDEIKDRNKSIEDLWKYLNK